MKFRKKIDEKHIKLQSKRHTKGVFGMKKRQKMYVKNQILTKWNKFC